MVAYAEIKLHLLKITMFGKFYNFEDNNNQRYRLITPICERTAIVLFFFFFFCFHRTNESRGEI